MVSTVRRRRYRSLVIYRQIDRWQSVFFGNDAWRFPARIAAFFGWTHHERKANILQHHPKPHQSRFCEFFQRDLVQRAIPTALAPLLGLVIASVVAASYLPTSIHAITGQNVLLMLILSPFTYACWPSSVDWKLSLRGWPIYLGSVAYLAHVAGWFSVSGFAW